MKTKKVVSAIVAVLTVTSSSIAGWCHSDPAASCQVATSWVSNVDCGTVYGENGCCKKKEYTYLCVGSNVEHKRWVRSLITPGTRCNFEVGPLVNGNVTGTWLCETPWGGPVI